MNYHKHRFFHILLRKLVLPLSTKIFIKRINGLGNIKKDKAFIIASNHTSFLDPLIIGSILSVHFDRWTYYIGKKELFRTFPSRIFHEASGTIPLNSGDKGKSALKIAENYLKNGKVVGIFPEGKRSPDGKLLKGRTGIARLVLTAKVPVLPIAIKGPFNLMPIGRLMTKFKKEVIVNVGKFMYFGQYYDKKINKKILNEITENVMANIQSLMI